MKSSVAVALIAFGALLIVAPWISNTIETARVAAAITEVQKPVTIQGSLPSWYPVAGYIAGVAMILTGAFASSRPAIS